MGRPSGAATGGAGYSVYAATGFTTPSFAGTLDHLDLPLSEGSCGAALAKGASVDLVNDDGGKPSEASPVLEHWLITTLPNGCGIVKAKKLASKKFPTLAGSTKYWVVVTPVGFDNFDIWNAGLSNSGDAVLSFNGGASGFPASAAGVPRPMALDVWIQ